MTRRRKIILGAGGLALVAIVALYFSPPARFVRGMTAQMQAGRIFMDSLTDADIQKWIIRADTLLADQALNSQQVVNIPVPKNLSALKIGRIDVSVPDYVAFIWVGGMDHTGLIIQKDANGSHRVIARYDDEHEKQLWPKENTNNVQ